MRLIHAVRDLSAETGTRIETVALYTDADRSAMFVREADLAYPHPSGATAAEGERLLARLAAALAETLDAICSHADHDAAGKAAAGKAPAG